MKNIVENLSGPKIVIGAAVIATAIVVFMMVITGGDATGGHGHTH
jgi:hypothetical protein